MKTYGLFLVFLVLFTGMCFAATEQAPPAAAPAASAASSTSIWPAILKGLLAGAVASLLGWAAQAKASDGTHESFDIVQFVITLLIGAGCGAWAGYKNIPLADVENMTLLSTVIAFVEMGIKAVWRNVSIHLADALATVKAGTAANPSLPAPAAMASTTSATAAPVPKTS